jgi:hypothetical protein
LRASKDSLYAGEELAWAERLDHIILSADLKAEDAINLLGPGGEENDGKGAGRADTSAEAEPVLAWHHDVGDDEIKGVGGQKAVGFGGIPRRANPEVVRLQISRERLAD